MVSDHFVGIDSGLAVRRDEVEIVVGRDGAQRRQRAVVEMVFHTRHSRRWCRAIM